MRNLKWFSIMLVFAMIASAGMIEAGTVRYEEHFNTGNGDYTAGSINGQNGWSNGTGDGLDVNAGGFVVGDGIDGSSHNKSLFSVPATCTDLRIQLRMRMKKGNEYDQLVQLFAGSTPLFGIGCNTDGWRVLKANNGGNLSISSVGGDEALSTVTHRYFQVRVDYDFVSDTGTISGYYEDGDGEWTTIASFTADEIGITETMDDPEEWSGLLLRCDHLSSSFDNICVIDRTGDGEALTYQTGLEVWLDGSDVDGLSNWSLTDGQIVNYWINQVDDSAAGDGAKGLAAKCGVFSVGTGNKGGDTVKLDGYKDGIQLSNFLSSDTYSIFAVAKCTGGSGYRPLYWEYGDNGVKTYFTTSAGNGYVYDANGQEILATVGEQLANNEWTRMEMIVSENADAYTVEVGEVGNTVTANNPSYVSTTWETGNAPYIGKFPNDGSDHSFEGEISEFLIYDHALSAADRATVEQYLANKHYPATVTTPTVSAISTTGSATLGATVTAGTDFTSWGTVWGTSDNPTGNSLAITNSETDASFTFSHTRTGMQPNTAYYYRGWASNAVDGIVYSDSESFKTHPVLQPYTADANTLHLYHFDEASGDIVDTGSHTTLYNLNHTEGDYEATAFSGFGNAFDIGAGGYSTSAGAYGHAGNHAAGAIGDWVGTDGAVTFEAMLTLDDITSWQVIFSRDGQDRGYNIWIQDGEIRIDPDSSDTDASATIPVTGDHTFVAGEWFHLAVTYDGNAGAADNTKIYWTKLSSGANEANLLATDTISADFKSCADGDKSFLIGSFARGEYRYNLKGKVDEVRISDIVREADEFLISLKVDTPTVSAISNNGATLGATVVLGADITSWGTVWGTTDNPTGNSLAITDAGTDAPFTFSHARTGMEPDTVYYYRGWASNATHGIVYSDSESFHTYGLQPPYHADAHTLHLYHCDEASGNIVDYGNHTTLYDFDNNLGTYGASAFTGFGNCFNIESGLNDDGRIGPALGTAGPQSDWQGSDGQVTFEAMLKLSDHDSGTDQRVFSRDGGGSGTGSVRGYNITITSGGDILVEPHANTAGGSLSVAIPVVGTHAFKTGEWFHIAVTYDGDPDNLNNTKIYWTRVNSGPTEANLLKTGNLSNDFVAGSEGKLLIGSFARGPYRYELQGSIDEVRISDIVREAGHFLFFVPSGTAFLFK